MAKEGLLALVAFCLVASAAATWPGWYPTFVCSPPPGTCPPAGCDCPSQCPAGYTPKCKVVVTCVPPKPPPPSPRPPPPKPSPPPPKPSPPPPSPLPPPPLPPIVFPDESPPPPSPRPPPPPPGCKCNGVPGTCVVAKHDPTDYSKGIVCSTRCHKEKCGYTGCGPVNIYKGEKAWCCFNSAALCSPDGYGKACASGGTAPGLCFCVKGLDNNAQCSSVTIFGKKAVKQGGCPENHCNAVFKDSFCCNRPGVDSVNTVCTGNPKGKKIVIGS